MSVSKARYPDVGGEDYLFLPDYPNRATASRIIQRQFNLAMERTGLKHDPVTDTERSVYCLRHTAICMTIIRSHGQVNIYNLAKNAGTSVDQIERFYAKHLPLSREMAKNLQSFRGGVAALTSAGPEALVSPVLRRGLELPWASRSSASAGYTKRAATRE